MRHFDAESFPVTRCQLRKIPDRDLGQRTWQFIGGHCCWCPNDAKWCSVVCVERGSVLRKALVTKAAYWWSVIRPGCQVAREGWDTSSWITGGRFYEILLFCDFRSLVPFRKLWERAAAMECNMSRCSPLRLFCVTTRAFAVEKWVRRRRKRMLGVKWSLSTAPWLSGCRWVEQECKDLKRGGIPRTWKVSI